MLLLLQLRLCWVLFAAVRFMPACTYNTLYVFVVVAVTVAASIASNDDYKTAIIAFSKAVKFEIDSKLVIIG